MSCSCRRQPSTCEDKADRRRRRRRSESSTAGRTVRGLRVPDAEAPSRQRVGHGGQAGAKARPGQRRRKQVKKRVAVRVQMQAGRREERPPSSRRVARAAHRRFPARHKGPSTGQALLAPAMSRAACLSEACRGRARLPSLLLQSALVQKQWPAIGRSVVCFSTLPGASRRRFRPPGSRRRRHCLASSVFHMSGQRTHPPARFLHSFPDPRFTAALLALEVDFER